MDFSRSYLKQVVAIHQAMFDRLLFDENTAISLDLAELFHDAGTTYLKLSQQITEKCLTHYNLQD